MSTFEEPKKLNDTSHLQLCNAICIRPTLPINKDLDSTTKPSGWAIWIKIFLRKPNTMCGTSGRQKVFRGERKSRPQPQAEPKKLNGTSRLQPSNATLGTRDLHQHFLCHSLRLHFFQAWAVKRPWIWARCTVIESAIDVEIQNISFLS